MNTVRFGEAFKMQYTNRTTGRRDAGDTLESLLSPERGYVNKQLLGALADEGIAAAVVKGPLQEDYLVMDGHTKTLTQLRKIDREVDPERTFPEDLTEVMRRGEQRARLIRDRSVFDVVSGTLDAQYTTSDMTGAVVLTNPADLVDQVVDAVK